MNAPDDEDLLGALRIPANWGWAAAALASRRDRRALSALIDAYDLEVEVSRIPLLDAMLALGARDAVSALSLSDDVSERILATRLARALPDPTHLESLERLAQDADAVVAQMARAALWGQVHDARWKAAVARLASSSRAEVREATSAWLSERQAARHVG